MPNPWQDVAAFDEIGPGEMRPVSLDGAPVLLFREGETVTAVSGTCPHAGAPLAQGVRFGARILCPWHKAAFCLRSGALLDPPAVDALAYYAVRVERGRILLSKPEPAPPPPPVSGDGRRFVIVGGGAAGAVAAQTLREIGFTGRIILLDRENRVPYDRTLLSKYVLSGEKGAEKTPLQPQSFYREHGIERCMAEVVRIDPVVREIECADGTTLRYDAALLATGAVPRRPHLPGAHLPGVFVLRGRGDAEAILARAERSERAVVLGTSFIGMEVAASLRERGLEVTVVGQEHAPFARTLGAEVGGAFTALHASRGVTFRLGQEVVALEGERELRLVRLADGAVLRADLVVIGFGVRPATDGLAGIDRDADGGVTVDDRLCVAEGLYAAGDIARFPLRGDGAPIRVEHWRVAQQQGRVAAHNMTGRTMRYAAVPVFWTIQYMKRLDYIGHADKWDEVVVHGDLGKPEFLAYYVRHGLVMAAVGIDRDQDTAALIALFEMRRDWTASELGERPAELLASLRR
jgi:NADPH-dependent 2,4-dienoyl-CoA reductase/sulfur reductase-like enzyme/nitrite reductase/ring-hydroxylating ferredoxin subunit